jgi:hypothetical protein
MISKTRFCLVGLIPFLVILVWSQPQSSSVTLNGIVAETTLLSNNDLHIGLQDGPKGTEVCLGSVRILQLQNLLPTVGDRIEVTGTSVGNGPLLMANSLQIGDRHVRLRGPSDATGRAGCATNGCGSDDCGACGHHGNHHHGDCCGHE